LDKNKKHSIEAIVDRLLIDTETETGRVADSVETALKLGAGVVLVSIVEGEELLFSEHFACVHCGISIGEIAPRTFSFNSPHGACPACQGLGVRREIDPECILPNRDLSLAVKERFAQLGIAFLLLLAVFVMYNDIMKTIGAS
jgi:excinuclease ABC subunit A